MPHSCERRQVLKAICASGIGTAMQGCGGAEDPVVLVPAVPPRSRSWRMGFSTNPPRFTVEAVLQTIDRFSTRAELVIIHEDLPWADLLAGISPDAIIDRDKQALVNYLRGKGLTLFFMLDLTDGLSRSDEARALRAAGRSLTEPAVQQLARNYAVAIERRLRPEYLGLAAETNLVRRIAPTSLYQALRQVANAMQRDLVAAGAVAKRFVSVQVETAWDRLGSAGSFLGIEQDFADFPFIDALGLSSYPYLGFRQPEDLPGDYYSRLRGTRTMPMLVTEGGWSSATLGTLISSPQIQARYIAKHAELLDSVSALAYLQLQYADIDLASLPPPIPANLPIFGSIGLADTQWNPKPALTEWDNLFRRPRT
jgi:hypothetical protein